VSAALVPVEEWVVHGEETAKLELAMEVCLGTPLGPQRDVMNLSALWKLQAVGHFT